MLVEFSNRRFEGARGAEVRIKLTATHPERLMQPRLAIILKYDEPRIGNPRKYIIRRCMLKERKKELIPEIIAPYESRKLPG
jgi:hypothetical protein